MNIKRRDPEPLPIWVSITVILADLALMGFNVVVYGPDGYPTTIVLAGVLAGYGSVNQYLRKKAEEKRPGGEDPK